MLEKIKSATIVNEYSFKTFGLLALKYFSDLKRNGKAEIALGVTGEQLTEEDSREAEEYMNELVAEWERDLSDRYLG